MKRLAAVFAALILSFCLPAFAAFADEHAEWDATAYEDSNYPTFYADGTPFTADLAIDGGLQTAWQKATGMMDADGNIAKECFVALTWKNEMSIESVNIWWRASTRAVASKEGYVLQYKNGDNWKDADASYSYNAEEQNQNGRNRYFVCDKITINGKLETDSIRVLVKKGSDSERGYSPKINEIEVAAQVTGGWDPVTPSVSEETSSEEDASEDAPNEETSSEDMASEPASSAADSSEEASNAPSRSDDDTSKTADTQSTPAAPESQAPQSGDFGKMLVSAILPWLITAAAAVILIVVAVVIIVRENRLSKK